MPDEIKTTEKKSKDEDTKYSLIVNYIPDALSQEDIQSLFSTIGEIHSCRLMVDKATGNSMGYAFVNYTKRDDAERAIKTFNGLKMQNKTLRVDHARPSGEAVKGSNVYVAGLPNDITREEFEEMFVRYGSIVTSVLLNEESGMLKGPNKGAGLIRFALRSEAERAILEKNGSALRGGSCKITVQFARTREEKLQAAQAKGIPAAGGKAPSSVKHLALLQRFSPLPLDNTKENDGPWTIYVSNLPDDTEEGSIWKMFAPFGAVKKVALMTDNETKKCKGVAFVTMNSYGDAVTAIQSLDGFAMGERHIKVAFKRNQNKTPVKLVR